MRKDIILSGVGGQGILTIATIIGEAATVAGLNLKQAEVHGMSQRGGDVQSNLRLSDETIHSDLISLGEADLIISMEPMEALRYLPYLEKEGWVVTSANPFKNIPNYPDEEELMKTLNSLPRVSKLEIICRNVRMSSCWAWLLNLLEFCHLNNCAKVSVGCSLLKVRR